MRRLERMTMEEATQELAWWGLYSDESTRERAFDELIGNVCLRAVDDPLAADVLRRIRKRAELSRPGRHRAPRACFRRLRDRATRA